MAAKQAMKDLRTFARMMKGIMELDGDLARVGELEDYENEVKKRVAVLEGQERGITAKLADADNAVAAKHQEAGDILAKSQVDAATTIAEAVAKAQDKAKEAAEDVAKAKAQADAIVTQARQDANQEAKRAKEAALVLLCHAAATTNAKSELEVTKAQHAEFLAEIGRLKHKFVEA